MPRTLEVVVPKRGSFRSAPSAKRQSKVPRARSTPARAPRPGTRLTQLKRLLRSAPRLWLACQAIGPGIAEPGIALPQPCSIERGRSYAA